MAYNKETDKNRDYQAEINDAVNRGDYNTASQLERDRNEKIEAENLDVAKTNKYQAPNGVDANTWGKAQEEFKTSADVNKADSDRDKLKNNYISVTGQKDIVSSDVWSTIDSGFEVPSAVTEADAYLSEQLQKIQSGKTSYSDQVQDMMDKIMNREKFSYDVDKDPLFQQALASAMSSGQQAMQDTIGQASALTGGYGSTYATTAGNQAYNAFIEDAYDNLPQYYQMNLEAYQMEGDELYRQYGMLSEMDDKEYNRNVTAYDATYQHRNQMYNEAYTQYRDKVSDAYAKANLQLTEYGQRVTDAYNAYSIASDYADTLYAREYDKWNAEVNQAMQMVQMQNSEYWNQTSYDRGVYEFDTQLKQQEEWHDEEMMYNRIKDLLAYEQTERFHKDEMDYSYAALNAKGSGGGGGGGISGRKYDFDYSWIENIINRPAVSNFIATLPTPAELKRFKDENSTYTYTVNVRDKDGNIVQDKEGKNKTIEIRAENYGKLVEALIENANKEGRFTEDEVKGILQYFYL